MMFYKIKKNKGFTLIELMVALSIFIVVMTVSMGSIIGVFDANRKSRSSKAVLNNLNLSVESMAREMRFGRKYHCSSNGSLTTPRNCNYPGYSYMSFLSSDNTQITYRLNNQAIEKQVDNEGFIPVTAPEIIVDDLKFYVFGALSTDNPPLQPKVIIKITSHAGENAGRSDLILETLVSQRVLDR